MHWWHNEERLQRVGCRIATARMAQGFKNHGAYRAHLHCMPGKWVVAGWQRHRSLWNGIWVPGRYWLYRRNCTKSSTKSQTKPCLRLPVLQWGQTIDFMAAPYTRARARLLHRDDEVVALKVSLWQKFRCWHGWPWGSSRWDEGLLGAYCIRPLTKIQWTQ